MEENTQDKSLIKINENNLFYKIRKFFKNLFSKKATYNDITIAIMKEPNIEKKENHKASFMEFIRNTEDEEIRLLGLQRQYRSKEIKEEDMTKEQINHLCLLYDRQIEKLKKTIEIKKQKLKEIE